MLVRPRMSLYTHTFTKIYKPPRCVYSTSTGQAASDEPAPPKEEEEPSALQRRFEALAQDALIASPRKAAKTAQEAAIADEIKSQLVDRLTAAEFKSTYATAHSISALPASAGRHSREIAASRAWDGTESTEDAVLRMLHDSKPRLKYSLAQRSSRIDLNPVDPRPSSARPSRNDRVSRARDASLGYSLQKSSAGLTNDERESMRAMFRDRFTPSGRPVASVSALMSLADQRIEDGRARGQFDNLPRGKPLVKDHNASSPYIDTTEYYLNKMIKRQEILPPWVEKQQERAREVDRFRKGLRGEWRRTVARAIAARGGGVKDAEGYAVAEARHFKLEAIEERVRLGEDVSAEEIAYAGEGGGGEVYRDTNWEQTQRSYQQLQINSLNALTRSYNLLAPELARKPLLSLDRELRRCYADVAPTVADEIRARAARERERKNGGGVGGGTGRGLRGKLGIGEMGKVYDEVRPQYGFRDFWRDLLGREKEKS